MTRAAPKVLRIRAALAACAAVVLASATGHTQSPAPAHIVALTNVPDAVTRSSGLRVEPMPRPARIYAENCQGCHGWTGVSVTEIPTLAGRIGYFARTEAGRRYLMQVPNVALNPSSDGDIAGMMNWLLGAVSREQLPSDFEPYSAEEVGRLRKIRIDAPAERRRVIDELVAAKQIPSPDVLAIPHAPLY